MAETTDYENEAAIPRMRMSEVGYVGLNAINGRIYEESRKELRWPESIKTFKKMSVDTTIFSALQLFELMVSRVPWSVAVPEGAKETTLQRAKFIESCMHDMEHSWPSFIQEVTSVFTYGFCVNEKVYRRRYNKNGSKFNDGLVGLKKLPIRSQDTIYKWLFSEDGRELIGLEQNLSNTTDSYRYIDQTQVKISRNKFLLFRTNVKKDSPEGRSPLIGTYHSWKYRMAIEEQEAIGVTRNLSGMPVLSIHPRYMATDASDPEKDIYLYYQKVIRNIQNNEQSGLILPAAFDPETRQPLFDFKLMSVQGTSQYDTTEIINRYDNKILMALFSDLLKMGQDQVGSYSLAGEKTNIMAMAIEAKLKEIQDVLNKDLMVQLFQLNGWSLEELPYFKFGDIDNQSMDEFSKFVQRVASVNMLEFDRDVANKIREVGGIKLRPEDEEIDRTKLTKNESGAGEGGATAGEGTSTSISGKDESIGNLENA